MSYTQNTTTNSANEVTVTVPQSSSTEPAWVDVTAQQQEQYTTQQHALLTPETVLKEGEEIWQRFQDKFESSVWFKLHLGIAVLFFVVSFIVSISLGFANVTAYPWFLYVGLGFCITLTLHLFGFPADSTAKINWFQLHVVLTVITSLAIFIAWVFAHSKVQWFAPVITSFSVPLCFHYWCIHQACTADRWLKLHANILVPFNVTMMVTCLVTSHSSVYWAVFIHLASGLVYFIHHSWHYHPFNFWRLHCISFVFVQVILFTAWGFSKSDFPWFAIVLFVWGAVLLVHAAWKVWRIRFTIHTPAPESIPVVQPPAAGSA